MSNRCGEETCEKQGCLSPGPRGTCQRLICPKCKKYPMPSVTYAGCANCYEVESRLSDYLRTPQNIEFVQNALDSTRAGGESEIQRMRRLCRDSQCENNPAYIE